MDTDSNSTYSTTSCRRTSWAKASDNIYSGKSPAGYEKFVLYRDNTGHWFRFIGPATKELKSQFDVPQENTLHKIIMVCEAAETESVPVGRLVFFFFFFGAFPKGTTSGRMFRHVWGQLGFELGSPCLTVGCFIHYATRRHRLVAVNYRPVQRKTTSELCNLLNNSAEDVRFFIQPLDFPLTTVQGEQELHSEETRENSASQPLGHPVNRRPRRVASVLSRFCRAPCLCWR
ncbi:Hypp1142 [Branchiostoma lanceolatum]|uniref:Hypp1142 protein n=1 Tax=Branchiostoma lanceolatum TaxID=7740 RepID=A0A8J9ZGN9_BRALA|nr:Hypp1142 [Branchiostoma lanceolatum]